MIIASVDLGTENLGVWCGEVLVSLLEKGEVPKSPLKPANSQGWFVIYTGRKRLKIRMLYWDRVKITKGLVPKEKIIQKKSGASEFTKIDPTIAEKVDRASDPDMIPAVIREFAKHKPQLLLIESQLTNMQQSYGGRGGGDQTAGNVTMKIFSHIIQVLAKHSFGPRIEFVSGHSTIPMCMEFIWHPKSKFPEGQKEPLGEVLPKPRKKALAVNVVAHILGVCKVPHFPELFFGQKKKDDMADAFLQTLGYLRTNSLETSEGLIGQRQIESKVLNESKKRKVPSEPEVEQLGEPKKKLTMSHMKAELKKWKCKGYASLKREKLEIFYSIALKNYTAKHKPTAKLTVSQMKEYLKTQGCKGLSGKRRAELEDLYMQKKTS